MVAMHGKHAWSWVVVNVVVFVVAWGRSIAIVNVNVKDNVNVTV
jgi:hypothetical protein